MEFMKVLRCPKTGNKLRFSDADSVVYVENSDITYPIIDGIVDFCPQVRDIVSRSYDKFASRYDEYITSSSVLMKLLDRFVWGSAYDTSDLMTNTVLSNLPSKFEGVLLDVPVGTGVFTDSQYAQFPNATIIAVDYSMGMLQKSKERFAQKGLTNVFLVRADIANLPLTNDSADIILSMNGLHAFKDKQRATAEMKRVIKKDGSLVACCYVKGDSWRWDFCVKYFGVRRGFFNPPFFTKDSIGTQLDGFEIRRQVNNKSLVSLEAGKIVEI